MKVRIGWYVFDDPCNLKLFFRIFELQYFINGVFSSKIFQSLVFCYYDCIRLGQCSFWIALDKTKCKDLEKTWIDKGELTIAIRCILIGYLWRAESDDPCGFNYF